MRGINTNTELLNLDFAKVGTCKFDSRGRACLSLVEASSVPFCS